MECNAGSPVVQFYYYRSRNWIHYNQEGDSIFNLNFEPILHYRFPWPKTNRIFFL